MSLTLANLMGFSLVGFIAKGSRFNTLLKVGLQW